MKVRLEFEPRDLWIGCYLKSKVALFANHTRTDLHIWLTLIPMFPLHITIKGALR